MKYVIPLFLLSMVCYAFGQQVDYVDFKKAKSHVDIDPFEELVTGDVVYAFKVLKDVDSVYLDAKNMKFSNVRLIRTGSHVDCSYDNNSKRLVVHYKFKSGEVYELTFKYSVKPEKTMYFIGWNDVSGSSGQVWTQGQGKDTSHWLPSIDDMNDKIEFDLSVTFAKAYEVIANGSLIDKEIGESTITWHYNMNKPMSSYLVALIIGKYDKNVVSSKSGIPLEMYYYPKDSLKFEPTYRYTKHVFDFLEKEIDVPYPWQNYKMVPVKDFLYAGMENVSLNTYSDSFVVDSIAFVDKNFVNINAHELAHQWFGDLVTEISGTHHWLQEGFATYYALLAEGDIFGDNYYYWRLYEYVQELLEQDKGGQGTSLLDPKSSSVTFYKRGAWVLHVLREKVGDKAFCEAIKNYLMKHRFKNVKTDDFIDEVERSSGQNLDNFVETWLVDTKFNYDKAIESLKKSTFIQEYLMVDCEAFTSKCKQYLGSWISDEAKSKIIYQIPDYLTGEDFKNSIKVRQSIARALSKVPLELKSAYESLLDDKSYITIEAALFGLWNSFPEDRNKYLNKTREVYGFNDKNIRVLWLTLALVTGDFEPENDEQYFKELTNYTNPEYGFEIRQNAFQYLSQIRSCGSRCKENLRQASKHHNWRFSKFAKGLLKED